MDHANPAATEDAPPPRRPTPRHRWAFERLESRLLLSNSPIVATPAQLAQARSISGDVASGLVQAGSTDFYRLDLTADEILTATLHAPGALSSLMLLDAQGRELTQSDGLSATDRDDLIAQHLAPGTDYLEIQGRSGAGLYVLTAKPVNASVPDLPVSLIPAEDNQNRDFGGESVGDFNGDGRLDLVVATSDGVAVCLGEGDGTFAPPVIARPENDLTTLVVADFNGDGRPDLAVGTTGGQVSVLLGLGNGTFATSSTFLANSEVTSLIAGDFNGDGRPDLVTGTLGGTVEVMTGEGNGLFAPPTSYDLGASVSIMVATDLDGDGHLDLAVGTFGLNAGLFLLLGKGDGAFARPSDVLPDYQVDSLTAGDFNGDGRVDLATSLDGENNLIGVAILLGEGGGTFALTSAYLPNQSVSSLLVGDFNGDGRLDLAVADYGENTLSVLFGAGDGTFSTPTNYLPGARVSSLVEGNFNGDGRVDLAVEFDPNGGSLYVYGSGGVAILIGLGDGTFSPQGTGQPLDQQNDLIEGDFNGDGRADLAIGFLSSGISILLSEPNGSFIAVSNDLVGDDVVSLVAGDFNGDGRLDLAAGLVKDDPRSYGDFKASGVEVLLGEGDGTFAPPANYLSSSDFASLPFSGFSSIIAADVNSDGHLDLVANTIVLLGRGDGTFADPKQAVPNVGNVSSSNFLTGDFNGDGRVDFASAYQGILEVALNEGGGVFRTIMTPIPVDDQPTLIAGDFNGDGRLDLAVGYQNPEYVLDGSPPNTGVLVLLGGGDGTFQPTMTSLVGDLVNRLVAGDFNGDGRVDLAVSDYLVDAQGNVTSAGLKILLGDGQGGFATTSPDLLDGNDPELVVADFNGDGRLDLATESNIYLGRGDGTFADLRTLAIDPQANSLVVDANGDLAIVDRYGNILLRRALPGQPGQYEPPVVINPNSPALDITILFNGGREFVVAADSKDDALSLYTELGGSFVRVGAVSTGSLPAQVVSCDLNGDGVTDLVVRNAADSTASVFLGLAGGGFRSMPGVSIGDGNSSLAVADLDSSGHVGLIVTNQVNGDVSYYPGFGNGTFGLPTSHQAGVGPYAQGFDAADSSGIRSDNGSAGAAILPTSYGGPLGLVVINPGTNTLAVLDGLGGGALANARIIPTPTPSKVVRVGSFRGRGAVDLAVLGAGGVTIYLADGSGGFTKGQTLDVGPDASGLTVADLSHDGKYDLLVGNTFGDVLILVGRGDGTFEPYRKTDRAIALAVADLTGDGKPDFIYADQALDRVSVQYGGTAPTTLAGKAQGLLAPGAVSLVYFPGDPIPDLVVANSGSNNILVFPGLGNGQFGPATNGGHGYFTGTNPVGITVADLNGDGIPDLVVANRGSNDVSVFYGSGSGANYTLQTGPRLKAGQGPSATVVATRPGQLQPDILVSDSLSNQVRLIPGVGQGFFDDQHPSVFGVGTNPGPIFVGNFTGVPGELDLITVNAGSNDLTLVRDFEQGGIGQSLSSGGIDPVAAVAFEDDGRLDLLVANEGDGTIALFLGGLGELSLGGEMTDPETPNPTALALDALTGNVLEFYVGTEGREAATRLAFNLGGGGDTGGDRSPIVEPPPAISINVQVAELQPLGEGSSLALVASLSTVSLTFEEAEAGVLETSAALPASTAALPNQSPVPEETSALVEEEVDPEGEGEAQGLPPDSPAALSPLDRFLYGLDEALERVRLDAKEATGPRADADGAGRPIIAIGAVLTRSSPVLTVLGRTFPSPAGYGKSFGVVPRSTDRGLSWGTSPWDGTTPREIDMPNGLQSIKSAGLDPFPSLVAAASIGLIAINKRLGNNDQPRQPEQANGQASKVSAK